MATTFTPDLAVAAALDEWRERTAALAAEVRWQAGDAYMTAEDTRALRAEGTA